MPLVKSKSPEAFRKNIKAEVAAVEVKVEEAVKKVAAKAKKNVTKAAAKVEEKVVKTVAKKAAGRPKKTAE